MTINKNGVKKHKKYRNKNNKRSVRAVEADSDSGSDISVCCNEKDDDEECYAVQDIGSVGGINSKLVYSYVYFDVRGEKFKVRCMCDNGSSADIIGFETLMEVLCAKNPALDDTESTTV